MITIVYNKKHFIYIYKPMFMLYYQFILRNISILQHYLLGILSNLIGLVNMLYKINNIPSLAIVSNNLILLLVIHYIVLAIF